MQAERHVDSAVASARGLGQGSGTDTTTGLRRRDLTAGLLAAGASLPTLSWAQGSAAGRVLRVLVGFPPGGGTDAIARALAERLKDELGHPVVVENRPGAGGQIAAQALKAAAPDGNTVFLSHDHTISIVPLTMKLPGFEPAKDFVPVAGFATFVNALAVSANTPARNLNELVAWVRGPQGGKSNVGVPAPASVPEFLVKVLGERFRLDLAAAPYRGSAPMIADMLGNQIPAGTGSIPDFIEQHKAGRLRVIAVIGTQRQAVLPEVPTFAELGVTGFEDLPYYGLWAPAGTPAPELARLSGALQKVVAPPDVRERLTNWGLAVGHVSGPQLAQREHAYTQSWAGIIRRSGFVAQ